MLRILVSLAAFGALCLAQTRTLNIYWVDVEGGAATLIVAPTGESLLVDTGNPGQGDRDAKRIAEAAKAAGLDHIDHLLITHYHGDHIGGAAALANLIPIRHFYDHGPTVENASPQYTGYVALTEGKHTILNPGDKFTLGALKFDIVSAGGKVIETSLNRGVPASPCPDIETKPTDMTENGQSVGFLMQYGKFSFLDLGDLTWDRELKLACPAKIGEVTLLQATHHGFSNGQSGNPALVWSVRPQVVVVNNGARKGFSNGGYDVMAKISGIEGIWQGHRGEGNDAAHNTTEDMIANLTGVAADDQGHWIKASVAADGKYTVTNRRNNFSKSYTAR